MPSTPRVLLNATNIRIGGGIQVATSIIEQAAQDPMGYDWLFAVSTAVAGDLTDRVQDAQLVVCDIDLSRPTSLSHARRRLREAAEAFKPHACYHVFGPPYWDCGGPTLCGFADPWVIFGGGRAKRCLTPTQRLTTALKSRLKRSFLRPTWNYAVETHSAQRALATQLGIDESRIDVVPNAPHQRFARAADTFAVRHARRQDVFHILCIGADYPHKHWDCIPNVARIMKALSTRPFRFTLTLPPSSPTWQTITSEAHDYAVQGEIVTVGKQSTDECIALYRACDAVFLPSVLEVFSATYVEALLTKRPLVAARIEPAIDICAPYSLLYEPFDDEAAALILNRLATDPEFYDSATRRLADLQVTTATERYIHIVEALSRIIADYPSS